MKRLLLLSIMMLVLIINQLNAQSNEGLWPTPIISGRDTIIVYPPQFESWNGNVLKGRSAVQYLRPGKDEAFGIISFTSQTETSIPRSLVFINNFIIDECNFPAMPDKGQSLNPLLTQQLSEQSTIPLEQVKSGLANNQTNSIPTTDVVNDAPQVYYSSKPAVLLLVDGLPHKQKTESENFDRIMNTSVFMVWNKNEKVYEASLFGKWFKSSSLDSTWSLENKPDKNLKNILKSALMADTTIQTFDPPSQEIGNMLANGETPRIYANIGPAELLITDGTPRYEPINGTNLLYVTNTNVDLFKYVGDGMNYVLLSGRWFKASDVKGKWTFVPSDQLPSDFNRIPEEHAKSNALVSVPGTAPAQEAAISSQIPQTATVDRQYASMQTSYDGNPQFEPISGTNMQYAVNTNTPVIYYDNSYYAVTNGVWYNSMYPTGPWNVAIMVPQVIYTIPPSNPIYYVTYVRIYGYTPTVVYMGYTPGYYGCYVNRWGTVVYGTGYRYRPWLGNYWYGNPYSYGVGLSFGWSSWAGWSMGFGYGRAYYPVARPWWGPVAYGPNRCTIINHTQVNIYNYNHHTMIHSPSCSNTNPRFYGYGNQHYGNSYHGNNNYQYYAGHDGHIYRNNSNGQWQQHNGNGWQAVNHDNGNHNGWGNQGNNYNGNNGNHYGWNNQGNNSNGNSGNHYGWNNQGNNSNGNNGNQNGNQNNQGNNGNHYGWNNQGNNSNGNNGNQNGNQNNQGNNGNHYGWNNQGNNSNGNNGNQYGNQNNQGNNGNHYGWNNQGNNSNGNNGNQNGNQNNQGNNGNHYGWNNQGNNSNGNNGNQNGNQNNQGNNGNHYGWSNQGNNSNGNNGNQYGNQNNQGNNSNSNNGNQYGNQNNQGNQAYSNQNYQSNNGNHYGWSSQGNNSSGNQTNQSGYSNQNYYQQQHQARQLSQDRVQSQNNYYHVNSGSQNHGGGSYNNSYRGSGNSYFGGGHNGGGGGYSGGGHSGGGSGYSRSSSGGGGGHYGGRR